jgi:hypothetical protein
MSELIALICKQCGGQLKVSPDKVEIDQGIKAVILKPGVVIKCEHCETEHVNSETKEVVWALPPTMVIAAAKGSVAVGGSINNCTIITGNNRVEED